MRADSNQAVLYNYGTDFRRRPTSRFDDRSDVFLIDAVALIEAMKPYDASVVDRPHRPFEHCAGTVDSMTLHQERLLFAYLRGTAVPDDGLVHDTVFGIIDAVIQGIACREQPRRTPGSATLTRNRERVDASAGVFGEELPDANHPGRRGTVCSLFRLPPVPGFPASDGCADSSISQPPAPTGRPGCAPG